MPPAVGLGTVAQPHDQKAGPLEREDPPLAMTPHGQLGLAETAPLALQNKSTRSNAVSAGQTCAMTTASLLE